MGTEMDETWILYYDFSMISERCFTTRVLALL